MNVLSFMLWRRVGKGRLTRSKVVIVLRGLDYRTEMRCVQYSSVPTMIDSASLIPSVNPYPKPASGETPGTSTQQAASRQINQQKDHTTLQRRDQNQDRNSQNKSNSFNSPPPPFSPEGHLIHSKSISNSPPKEAFCAAAAPALSPFPGRNYYCTGVPYTKGSTVSYCMTAQEIDAATSTATAAPAV